MDIISKLLMSLVTRKQKAASGVGVPTTEVV